MDLKGIYLFDKPKGWTSFDVVAKFRGQLQREHAQEMKALGMKRIKVGHTGTLDPLATGLLVVAVGKTTKDIPKLIKMDKTYIVDAILGETSTTGDAEGEITKLAGVEPPLENAITDALARFEGQIMQKPPAYSAIKIDGQRAYKLARAGKAVELEARPVIINKISDVSYEWPNLRFTADVSSGTYIRSLVEDVGRELGVGAYMSDLRRTRIGEFKIENAASL